MSTPKSERKKKDKKHKDKKRRHSTSSISSSSTKKFKKVINVDDEPEVLKVEEVIPLPVASSKLKEESTKDDNDGEDKAEVPILNVKVPAADPKVDPIVVSFASGVPTSILSNESQSGKTVRFRKAAGSDGSSDDSSDDNDDDKNQSTMDGRFAKDAPTFHYFQASAKNSSHKKRMVCGNDSTCTYSSAPYTPSTTQPKISKDGDVLTSTKHKTKLYIGVYDKQTRSLALQPTADKCTIHTLSQSVSSYAPLLRQGNYIPHTTTEFQNLTMMQRRNLLFDDFGSSKKKRVIKSQAENVVSVDNVLGAGSAMMEAVSGQMSSMSESNRLAMEEVEREGEKKTDAVAQAYDEARKQFLPPFDTKTTKPSKIYLPKKIAGQQSWSSTNRIIEKALQKEDWKEALSFPNKNREFDSDKDADLDEGKKERMREHMKWCDSVTALLHSVNPSRASAKERLKAIVILAHMVRFHKAVGKRNFIKGHHDEVLKRVGSSPYEVISMCMDTFLVNDGNRGYSQTKQLRDKRVVYLLILYILVASGGGGESDDVRVGSINSFMNECEIPLRDAMMFLTQAGFKVKKGVDGTLSVSLNAPVEFPPPIRPKRGS